MDKQRHNKQKHNKQIYINKQKHIDKQTHVNKQEHIDKQIQTHINKQNLNDIKYKSDIIDILKIGLKLLKNTKCTETQFLIFIDMINKHDLKLILNKNIEQKYFFIFLFELSKRQSYFYNFIKSQNNITIDKLIEHSTKLFDIICKKNLIDIALDLSNTFPNKYFVEITNNKICDFASCYQIIPFDINTIKQKKVDKITNKEWWFLGLTFNNDNIDCSICLNETNNNLKTKCGHVFCKPCIFEWSKMQNTCPHCRKSDICKSYIYKSNGNDETVYDYRTEYDAVRGVHITYFTVDPRRRLH